jgi:hypothetical protein
LSASSLASSAEETRLPHSAKSWLAVRIWVAFLQVRLRLRNEPLPTLVTSFGRPRRRLSAPHSPERLSRAVNKSLRLGARRPRCLTSALVLFRLLRAQGDAAELVIGLPPYPDNHEAHAWVELQGVDVGPPPGRGHHVAMARFR